MAPDKKQQLKEGFIFFLLSTLSVACQFVNYLWNDSQMDIMDFGGIVFYIAAALSHAALFTLPFFLILFLPLTLFTNFKRTANVLLILGGILVNIFFCINGYVYSLYKFHINDMVLGLYFGEGGSEIISFDTVIYIKSAIIIVLIIALNIAFRWLAGKLAKKWEHPYRIGIIGLVCLLVFSNIYHAYAAAAQKQSVMRSSANLPYYFPLTANRLMIKLGVINEEDLMKTDFDASKGSNLCYPLKPLEADSVPLKNIVIIAIDSWNYRTYGPEVTPNIYAFGQKEASLYTNHLSSSNGTRGSIFGMFFGISSYYWNDCFNQGTTPVLIDEMLAKGYAIKTFPSATMYNPNFAKLIFRKAKDFRIQAKGKTVYDRDVQLTKDFCKFLDSDTCKKQPFFSFLFYDLAHSGEYPKDRAKKFTPSWEFPDYMKLNNDMDPTPYWNLYRNCVSAVDSLVGIATRKLEEKGLLDNTIIIITGDHGQEFNENHKNYWGHGSNYTYPQIHIPFLYHQPGKANTTYTHRTTHYDVAPTLLHEAMGVKNDPADFCMGRLLSDTTFRNWHIVGDNLDFAFIVEGNTIIEKKPSGSLDIYDATLNPIDNYKLKSKELNDAISALNKFYKK